MKGSKIIKIILIVILVLVVLFLANTIRKFIIVKDLQNKISKYISSNNFYMIVESDNTINGKKGKTEYYKKDDKELLIMYMSLDSGDAKISSYNNGKRIDTFTEGPDYKRADIDSNFTSKVSIVNGIEDTGTDLNTFLACIIGLRISRTKYNDIDCYLVKLGKDEYYIEKDTGLLLKSLVNDTRTYTYRTYEFDTVTDEIFIEPDISEYEIVK